MSPSRLVRVNSPSAGGRPPAGRPGPLDRLLSGKLGRHQGLMSSPHLPSQVLLRSTEILGNGDGKPIKSWGVGVDKELLRMNSVHNYSRFC